MRTQQQILGRIEERKDGDFFGFEWHEYLTFLTFDNAKKFLKDDADPSDWEVSSFDDLKPAMEEYMAFAWEKANDRRGLSANRSISHFIAWTWLNGDEDLNASLVDQYDGEYEYYGKPILVKVAEHYGWDWRQWDDGQWTNTEYGGTIMTADQALNRTSEKDK